MPEVQRTTLSSAQRAKLSVAFDWLLRPRKFLDTPHGMTAYLSAAGCFCGAILFLIAVCAASVPRVAANFTAGDGLQSTYDWLVLLCSMLGSKFFGLGCAASFILGNNLDYAHQLAAWKAQGKLGSPPRYKWVGFHPGSLYWWGGVLYILGNVQYNIASTCSFAHNFPQQHKTWSADVVKWLITVMYTSGGACYLLAGLFYVLTDTGPKFWKGVFVPTQKQDRRRLTWWINWLNFWGAVMYCIGGVFMNCKSRLPYHPAYQVENAVNEGGGSLCYAISGLLCWFQLSLTADEASTDKPLAQQSISLTAHGGTAPTVLAGPQGNSTAEVLAQIV